MSIDIIIPNYNGARLFEKNLPSVLEAHKNYSGKVIIVDDGSKKEDLKKLAEIIRKLNSKKIIFVRHQRNKGFSSAINTGIKNSDSEFIVFLNSDVVPSKNFLESPIQKMNKNQDLFGVGFCDESIEIGKIVNRGRGIGYWDKGFLKHKRGEIDKSDTFWISGGSSIVRSKILLKLEGMDELFNPFYWEDIDLSYRAQKAGYTIEFDRDSRVKHFHEDGSIKKQFSSKKVAKIAYRNQFIFIWKNINSPHLVLNHLVYLPINMMGAVKRQDWAFFSGLILAVILLPAIIRKRFRLRKINKVSDLKLISKIL